MAADPHAGSTAWLCIAASRVGRRAVLQVGGEVDLATAPQLERAIQAEIDGGAHDLWIDLALTDFMDSSGVNVLIRARRRLRPLGRRLAVIATDGAPRRTLEAAGLIDELAVHRSRAAAARHA